MLRGLLTAALITGPAVTTYAEDGFEITAIRAHLFYEYSGTLSPDILSSQPVLWNTVIGEGDAAEPASDVLVVVEMRGPYDGSTEIPLVVEATSEREGVVMRTRRSFGHLFTEFGERRIARAIWIQDQTCEQVRIVATHGRDRREAVIPFYCGE